MNRPSHGRDPRITPVVGPSVSSFLDGLRAHVDDAELLPSRDGTVDVVDDPENTINALVEIRQFGG